MINYINKIIKIGKNNNGYITNKELMKRNIPTVYLKRMCDDNLIRRIDRGIYIMDGFIDDEFYTYYLKYPKIVYSRRSAIYLHGLTNRRLSSFDVNVPSSYHIQNIPLFTKHYVNDVKYNLGITEVITSGGNIVKTYDRERCICDLFLYDYVDLEEMRYIIQQYKEGGVKYSKLYDYGDALGVSDKISVLLNVI